MMWLTAVIPPDGGGGGSWRLLPVKPPQPANTMNKASVRTPRTLNMRPFDEFRCLGVVQVVGSTTMTNLPNWRAERRFSVFPVEMTGIRLFWYSGLIAPADGRGRVCTQISTKPDL